MGRKGEGKKRLGAYGFPEVAEARLFVLVGRGVEFGGGALDGAGGPEARDGHFGVVVAAEVGGEAGGEHGHGDFAFWIL